IWARRPSKAASTWAKRSSSTSRPSPTGTARPTACSRRCSRVETQSGPPDDRSGNGDGCCEVDGELVVTGGDAAPILQPAQGAFDDVAALVGFCVEGVEAFARRIVRDHRKGAALEEEPA